MEYVGFVFGIFGLLAYIELSSLKKRVNTLEEELAGIAGTSSFEERRALLDAVDSYIGKQVVLDLKEACEDNDIVMYGNSKHGTNTILDADSEWLLVRIESAKGSKEKLLRAGSIRRISLVSEV
ncbi:MAG: hypothetical protein IJQ02_07875 [Oscillospiraceae bacterium]|nr:hypothetical protein [Oscillospiraceae bacterium]